MARPVEAVEEQMRTWRESPAEARRRLESCARAFAQRALAVEEALEALTPRAGREAEPASPPERQWRWKQKGYVLFWAVAAALSMLALVAGYFAAFEG